MTNNSLIYKYLTLKLPQSHSLTPRVGFYAIGEVKTNIEKYGTTTKLAKALWSEDINFSDYLEIDVRLSALKNNESIGPKSIGYDQLTNMIIEIKAIELLPTTDAHGIPRKTYKIIWDIRCRVDDIANLYIINGGLSDDEYDQYLDEELELICYEYEESFLSTAESEALLDYYQAYESNEEHDSLIIDELNRLEIDDSDSTVPQN
jgi:hypothetical protein